LGPQSVTAEVAVPGFVSPAPASLEFTVVNRELGLALVSTTPAEDCGPCGAGQYQTTLRRGETEAEVVRFSVEIDAGQPAAVTLESIELPDFVQLRDARGVVLTEGTRIEVPAGVTTLDFQLVRAGAIGGGIAADARVAPVSFTIAPAEPASGPGLPITGDVVLNIPDPELTVTAYDKGSPEDGALKLTEDDLRGGTTGMTFTLDKHLKAALEKGDFRADVSGYPLSLISAGDLSVDPATGTITAKPETRFCCLCWVGVFNVVFSPERQLMLSFRDDDNAQRAVGVGTIRPVVSSAAMGWSCLFNLFVLLVVLWLLWSILAIFRTQRFPQNAFAIERRPNQSQKRPIPLRGRNWTFPRVLLSPITGPPHERAEVGGMTLQATPEGANILLQRNANENWIIDVRGMSIREIRELTPDHEMQPWPFGTDIQNERDKRHKIKLVRDANADY
jgi:hypothetical protein